MCLLVSSLCVAFLAEDKDGDGTVSTEEMGQVLKQVNPKFTEASEAKREKTAPHRKERSSPSFHTRRMSGHSQEDLRGD